ncbi:MAG: hypothetical protein LBK54_01685 [Propionibacteriaceae bacterium]|jgi:hypothetical protein|nr:hypothetical protein [Propionibacteriaceae bacterium]
MTEINWDNIPPVDVPAGSFIGWGLQAGQHVTGRVVAYSYDGGTDFNDNPCPRLDVELTLPAASFDKDGVRSDFQVGALVSLTCGQARLKAGVRAMDPSPGDLVRIVMTGLEKTPKGAMKLFSFQKAPASAAPRPAAPSPTPASAAPAATPDPWQATQTAQAAGGNPFDQPF